MDDTDNLGNKLHLADTAVRVFLRDTDPAANLLLDDFEFTQEELRLAHELIVDKWNETPPPVHQYTYDEFPFRYHLLLGMCSLLLGMAANRYRRNDLKYDIGGGAIQDQAKAQDYDRAADRLMAEFMAWMGQEKLRQNIDRGFGGDTGRYF